MPISPFYKPVRKAVKQSGKGVNAIANSIVGGAIAAAGTYFGNTQTSNNIAGMLSSNMKTKGKTYTKTQPKRKRNPRYKTTSFAKRVANTLPAKHFNYAFGQTLNKTVVYYWSPTQAVIRGTQDNQRVGDTIHLAALKVNGFFNTNATASVYQYRIIVGFTGEEFAAATINTGSFTGSQFFQSSGIVATNGIINPKAFTTLYDEKIIVNSVISGIADGHPVTFTVPMKDQKFMYQADGATYGKLKNLVLIVIGDDLMSSQAADAGGFSATCDFIFK